MFDKILVNSMRKWKHGLDERLIDKFVWPYIVSSHKENGASEHSDLMAHDSYTCIHFKDKQPAEAHRPFPTRRNQDSNKLNFVGQRVGKYPENGISLEKHGTCPMICRPKEHPDWILC